MYQSMFKHQVVESMIGAPARYVEKFFLKKEQLWGMWSRYTS